MKPAEKVLLCTDEELIALALKILELQEVIQYYQEGLKKNIIQVDLMFARKTESKKNIYKTWMFRCCDADIIEMVDATLTNIYDITKKRTIDKYDLEVSTDETIQVIEEAQVIHYQELKNDITLDYSEDNEINADTDFNKLDLLVMQLSDNGDQDELRPTMTILKKYMKEPAKFSQRGLKRYVFNGQEAKAIHKPMLIIGSNAEAFNLDGNFYILNRNSFNSMMKFKDVYCKVLDDHEKEIVASALLDDAKAFVEDCKADGRYTARLTKAVLAEGFKNVKNNKEKLSNLKKERGLKFEIDADGKIIYKKEYVNEILNLLLDCYVISELTDRRMLAKAIEKYE